MSHTPRTDAVDAALSHSRQLECELTKAINCARFMAAYLEDRGETSGRAYALCREIGWPQP